MDQTVLDETTATRLQPAALPAAPTREGRTLQVPAIDDGRTAKRVWYGVLQQIAPAETIVLDMTNVRAIDRSSIAALVGFVKSVTKLDAKLVMYKLPKETQAMLELLGVHYVAEFRT